MSRRLIRGLKLTSVAAAIATTATAGIAYLAPAQHPIGGPITSKELDAYAYLIGLRSFDSLHWRRQKQDAWTRTSNTRIGSHGQVERPISPMPSFHSDRESTHK